MPSPTCTSIDKDCWICDDSPYSTTLSPSTSSGYSGDHFSSDDETRGFSVKRTFIHFDEERQEVPPRFLRGRSKSDSHLVIPNYGETQIENGEDHKSSYSDADVDLDGLEVSRWNTAMTVMKSRAKGPEDFLQHTDTFSDFELSNHKARKSTKSEDGTHFETKQFRGNPARELLGSTQARRSRDLYEDALWRACHDADAATTHSATRQSLRMAGLARLADMSHQSNVSTGHPLKHFGSEAPPYVSDTNLRLTGDRHSFSTNSSNQQAASCPVPSDTSKNNGCCIDGYAQPLARNCSQPLFDANKNPNYSSEGLPAMMVPIPRMSAVPSTAPPNHPPVLPECVSNYSSQPYSYQSAQHRLDRGYSSLNQWRAPPRESLSDYGARTTLMLRNVPSNYTSLMLLKLFDERGFAGAYDFFYLPIDFATGSCLGYAFVNLVSPNYVSHFFNTFQGFVNWSVPSRKVCRVSWSEPHQGQLAHVNRYRNSPVLHESVPDHFKPMVFYRGERQPFPHSTKILKPPRLRALKNETDEECDILVYGSM